MKNDALETIFQIFTEVQTGTNTKENLDKLLIFYEKKTKKLFLENLEQVFLIIIKNFEKNNIPLKNIKDFLKQFIQKIVKIQKKIDLTKEFICHFCKFFTQNTKRTKYRSVSVYFLRNYLINILELFLSPYSNSFEGLYDEETKQLIKNYILTSLRSKKINDQMSVLKILQKNVELQRENDIWKCLEGLIENSPTPVKKEILKLLDLEDNNEKLKYLLDMYDDDNAEIRSLVYEKLSSIKNFDLIDTNNKVRMLFIGLSDKTEKVKVNAKKFFRNYLNFLGIFTDKADMGSEEEVKDKMALDVENAMDVSFRDNKKKDVDNNEDDNNLKTVDEKIKYSTSPLRLNSKKNNMKYSPAILFDKLNFINYYFNPKYSYVFQLVTDALIECSSYESLVELYEGILNHLLTSSNSVPIIKIESRRKILNNKVNDNNNFSLLYEILFLQNSIKLLNNNTKNEHYQAVNSRLNDLLPDTRTLAKILEYFYIEKSSPLILHQLFLISNYFQYIDEIGNRDMQNIIVQFLSEVNLDRKVLRPNLNTVKLDLSGLKDIKIEEDDDQELDITHFMITQVENMLLPPNRKLVETLEDLIDFALKILLNIFEKQHNQLFHCIMKLITDLKELIDGGEEENNSMKKKKTGVLDKIKEKLAILQNLREQKNEDKKKRIEFDKKIKIEEDSIEELDKDLLEVIREEKQIYLRILKLCEFLIKYCKITVNGTFLFFILEIQSIMNTILIPCIQKKEFPEIMRQSYLVMGVCSVNYAKEFNYLQLFFSNIDKNIKDNNTDFKDFDMTSLFVIFDAILHNDITLLNINTSVNEKMIPIIKKFLYHNDYLPRLITFIGLSKLLIADKLETPQYFLSRLIVQLFVSYEVIDKHSEEYHTKLYEIFQNFIFYYSRNVNNIKYIMESVIIVLTTRFLEPVLIAGSSNKQLIDTVLYNYHSTKMEHLISFINILNSFNSNFQDTNKFFIFKIFKYIAFFLLYINLDENMMENNKSVIKNLHFNKNPIHQIIKKFFEKSRLDRYLIEKMPENYKNKFNKILSELDNKQVLKKISDCFSAYLEEIKGTENNKLEEVNQEFNGYFDLSLGKYFKKTESYYTYLIALKDEKINIIYEEATYISDVDMDRTSAIKEKMIPSTVKKGGLSPKGKLNQKSKLDKSPVSLKRKKGFF